MMRKSNIENYWKKHHMGRKRSISEDSNSEYYIQLRKQII